MASTEQTVTAYECSSCRRKAFQKEEYCCGTEMKAIDTTTVFESAEIEQVVQEVFKISSTELAICHTIMATDETTIKELSRQIECDRSVINRHLNHLTELGLVEKRSESLPEGGRVNVYSPCAIDDIRQQFRLGLYAWMAEATDLIDELSQEKIRAMAEQADGEATNEPGSKSPTEDSDKETDEKAESGPESKGGRSFLSWMLGRNRAR